MPEKPQATLATPQAVLNTWFSEYARPLWFRSTAAFDRELKQRFGATVEAALAGGLRHWADTPTGALALVIVLDQLPLNIYRGRARAFAGEAMAREIAARAIERGYHSGLSQEEKVFLYLPFMHSENLDDQDRAVALFQAAGLQENLRYAHHHRDIVRRFGRFPHRNAILGRESTPQELEYLNSPEAFTG